MIGQKFCLSFGGSWLSQDHLNLPMWFIQEANTLLYYEWPATMVKKWHMLIWSTTSSKLLCTCSTLRWLNSQMGPCLTIQIFWMTISGALDKCTLTFSTYFSQHLQRWNFYRWVHWRSRGGESLLTRDASNSSQSFLITNHTPTEHTTNFSIAPFSLLFALPLPLNKKDL